MIHTVFEFGSNTGGLKIVRGLGMAARATEIRVARVATDFMATMSWYEGLSGTIPCPSSFKLNICSLWSGKCDGMITIPTPPQLHLHTTTIVGLRADGTRWVRIAAVFEHLRTNLPSAIHLKDFFIFLSICMSRDAPGV